nr:ribonuclease H-like domain, reverse transcriptase, RNA-dependent DNA polymerase [Tanacetum cinerariifolium]
MKVKGGLEYMSLDDRYNKLKCLEIDTKGYSVPAFALANDAFVSSSSSSSSRSKLSYQEKNSVCSSAKHSASKGSSSTQSSAIDDKEAAKDASESSTLVVIDGSQGVNWDKQLQEKITEPGVLGNYGFVVEKGTNSTVPADDVVPADAVPA